MKRVLLISLVMLLVVGCSFIFPTASATPTVTQTASPPTVAHTAASPTPTSTPFFTPTPLPPESVSYYRLRLVFASSSDWADFRLVNFPGLLSMRLAAVDGEPEYSYASTSVMNLAQPLADAEAGKEISMSVDLALEAPLPASLEGMLLRGSPGYSRVSLYLVEGEEMRLVQETLHNINVDDGTGTNPKPVSFDLTGLQDTLPLTVQVSGGENGLPRMVWAFYYPWYTAADWNSSILKDHPLSSYNSADHRTIQRHIAQAQSAGIDGFISSWWGPGSDTDRNLKVLLDYAAQSNFKVTVYFETLENDGPRSEQEIYSWLAYLIPTYRDHPAFMKVDGKPLVVVWVSGTVPLETWQRIFDNLRANGYDAVYLAMGYDAANLEVFDGVHEYGVFGFPDLEGTMMAIGRTTRYYTLLDPEHRRKIWAATVQPGYDDTLIPGREGVVQERMDGAYYRRTWEAALASHPDWVFITTWNEWWENTHIEPSQNFGELYLDITREYAARWKGQ